MGVRKQGERSLSIDPNFYLLKRKKFRIFRSLNREQLELLANKVRENQVRIGSAIIWIDPDDLTIQIAHPAAMNVCREEFDLTAIDEIDVRGLD